MKDDLKEKVSFDIIRYANCWEDAGVLLKGLNAKPASQILSIAAAGDNSFSLLTTHPAKVVAVDISKPQLYLVALKKQAIRSLQYEEVLGLLGFKNSANRFELFHKIENGLTEEARYYWNNQLHQIDAGIAFQGKFEKYFQLFVRKVLPWVHSKKDVQQLLQTKSGVEQALFYKRHWNTWRWRWFFKIFFSKFIMGRLGRDPEFLKEVQVHVGDFIFNRAEQHLQTTAAQQNFMLRYNLTASFGELLPHYLLPQNFEIIKKNIDSLEIKEGFADAVAETGSFDYMNLSNIFEYMNPVLFKDVSQKLIHSLTTGGRIAYWNLMVPRRLADIFPGQLIYLQKESATLTQQDKGFFYNSFNIDEKQ